MLPGNERLSKPSWRGPQKVQLEPASNLKHDPYLNTKKYCLCQSYALSFSLITFIYKRRISPANVPYFNDSGISICKNRLSNDEALTSGLYDSFGHFV